MSRWGRAHITGILDTVTGMSDGNVQYMYVSSTDATHITAKVKMSPGNSVDTQPRLTWIAEV